MNVSITTFKRYQIRLSNRDYCRHYIAGLCDQQVFIEYSRKSIQLVETTRSHTTEFYMIIKTSDMPLHQRCTLVCYE